MAAALLSLVVRCLTRQSLANAWILSQPLRIMSISASSQRTGMTLGYHHGAEFDAQFPLSSIICWCIWSHCFYPLCKMSLYNVIFTGRYLCVLLIKLSECLAQGLLKACSRHTQGMLRTAYSVILSGICPCVVLIVLNECLAQCLLNACSMLAQCLLKACSGQHILMLFVICCIL